jgi:hypothetical protein
LKKTEKQEHQEEQEIRVWRGKGELPDGMGGADMIFILLLEIERFSI